MTRHQAHRTPFRLDARYIGLALMLVSAAIVVAALYAIAVWFLSLGTYIESLPL